LETDLQISVSQPKEGDHVQGLEVEVNGEASIHEYCGHVFVFVHPIRGKFWKVTDVVQVNTDGKWSAIADLSNIGVGEEGTIEVRLVANPSIYSKGKSISGPPDRGLRSRFVKVRRIK
jgi:hypothetical protein